MLLTDNLDIVGVTSDGGLWHAKLVRGQGDTMPWEDIKRVQGAVEPAPFVRTDCTLWQEALHICVVSQDGKLWYEAPGQPLEDMSSHFDGSLGAFQDVSLTEFGGDLHVCAVAQNGWVIRLVRHANGQWEPLEDISIAAVSGISYESSFTRIDCAAGSQNLHVCVITEDGKLFYTRWDRSGWIPWVDGRGKTPDDDSISSAPDNVSDVSVSEENNELHVYALTQGALWHTVGRAGPVQWQPVLHDASVDIIDPGTFVAVDCASVEERLGYQRHVHVCGVTQDGLLWYKMNFVEPAVPQSFESVADKIQAPGPFVSVGVANSTVSLGQTSIPLTNCSSLQNQINALCGVVPRTPSNRHRIQVLLAEGRRIRCTLTVPGGCLS